MLNITEVRIKKINKGDLLAAASICIDNCFVIKEIKLLNGKNGKYISMPKRRMKNRNELDLLIIDYLQDVKG